VNLNATVEENERLFIDLMTKKNQNHINSDRFRKPLATDITLSNYSKNATDEGSAAHHFKLH
jgi:hypothetical protein